MDRIKSIKGDKGPLKITDLSKPRKSKQDITGKKETLKVTVLFIAVIMLLSIFTTAAYAHEDVNEIDDENGIDSEKETEQYTEIHARSMSVSSHDDYAEIESTYEDENTENALSIRLETGSNPRFEMEYSSESELADNSVEKELSLSLVFEEIIEYVDDDGDGRWSNGEEIVQTLNLDDYAFDAPVTSQVTSNGINGYRIQTQTTDSFTFGLVAHIYEERASHDSLSLKPTEMKFDIMIQNFPYLEQDTKLGLKIEVETEKEIQESSTSTEKNMEIESKDASAFFSWSVKCMVDGVNKDVLSSSIAIDEDGQTYRYLFYPRGDNILHDPILGVEVSIGPDTGGVISTIFMYAIGLLAASTVVVGAVHWRRKKNGMH